MSSNANRRDDDVSRAVRSLLYDRSCLGREKLAKQATPGAVRQCAHTLAQTACDGAACIPSR